MADSPVGPLQFNVISPGAEIRRAFTGAEAARLARETRAKLAGLNTRADFFRLSRTEPALEAAHSYARAGARARLDRARAARAQLPLPLDFNVIDVELKTLRTYARFDAVVRLRRADMQAHIPVTSVRFNAVDTSFDYFPSYAPVCGPERIKQAREERAEPPEKYQYNAVDVSVKGADASGPRGPRERLAAARAERSSPPEFPPESFQFNAVDVTPETRPEYGRFDAVVRRRKETAAEAEVSHAARLDAEREFLTGILERPAAEQLAELWDFHRQFTPQPQRQAQSSHRTLVTTRELLTNLEAEKLNVVSRRPEINPNKHWLKHGPAERTPGGEAPVPGDPFLPSPPFTPLERDEKQRAFLDSAHQMLERSEAELDAHAEARRKREFAERLRTRHVMRENHRDALWDWSHYVTGLIFGRRIDYSRFTDADARIRDRRLDVRRADRLTRALELDRRCDDIAARDKADGLRERSIERTERNSAFLEKRYYLAALDRRAELRVQPRSVYFDKVYLDTVYCDALADKDDSARFFEDKAQKRRLHHVECAAAAREKTDARLEIAESLYDKDREQDKFEAVTAPEPPPARSSDAQTARAGNNRAGAADMLRRQDGRLGFSDFIHEKRADERAFRDFVRDRHDYYWVRAREHHREFGQAQRDRLRIEAELKAESRGGLADAQTRRIRSAEAADRLARRTGAAQRALEAAAGRRAAVEPGIGAQAAERRAAPKLPDLAAEARAREEEHAKREDWSPPGEPPAHLGGRVQAEEDWRFRRLNAAAHRIEDAQRREDQAAAEARRAAEGAAPDPRARRGLIVSVAG